MINSVDSNQQSDLGLHFASGISVSKFRVYEYHIEYEIPNIQHEISHDVDGQRASKCDKSAIPWFMRMYTQ